jgi:glycosyltransferase involved in cell wall biosynthesis
LTRPRETLSVCINSHNEEKWIIRCIDSVKDIADEIIVADDGSTDMTVELAKRKGAKVISIPPLADGANPIGFGTGRNMCLKEATGTWFLWIDCDEKFENPERLPKYLSSKIFNGFVVEQRHLIMDSPNMSDMPIRLVRNNGKYQFFRKVHEHCMETRLKPITPALHAADLVLQHNGYPTENVRRSKCMDRNLRLLLADYKENPEDVFTVTLYMRDLFNFVKWEAQAAGGNLTDKAINACRESIQLYEKHFANMRYNKNSDAGAYFDNAFKQYQDVMQVLKLGSRVDWSAFAFETPDHRFMNDLYFYTTAHLENYFDNKIDRVIEAQATDRDI